LLSCGTYGTSAHAASFDWAQGWREVAHFDGSVPVTAPAYVSGLNAFASPNYARPLGAFDYADSAVTVAVTMGGYTDYFRPVAGVHRIRDMMVANNKHRWSSAPGGPFVATTYFTSGLGGSGFGFPSDGRLYLSFWGGGPVGGCCQLAPGDPGAWGRPFKVYLQVPMESLSVAVAGDGIVERSTDRVLFPSDSLLSVTLTAVPAPGWVFTGWSGDTSGTTNPVVLTMASDRAVTATFEQALGAEDAGSPARSALTDVGPNPSRGTVNIDYAIATATLVRLSVHDLQGRLVARLAEGKCVSGRYRAVWAGADAGPGVYFVRLEAGDVRMSRRLTVTE